MIFVCILQSWGIDDIISRTDEAEEESETSAESKGSCERGPKRACLKLGKRSADIFAFWNWMNVLKLERDLQLTGGPALRSKDWDLERMRSVGGTVGE